MDAHPLAERYPLMAGNEYETFKADIAANGLKNSIALYRGKILDGRNRYRACLELGIEPRFQDAGAKDDDEAAALVDSLNLHRRHLTAEFRRARVAEMRAAGMSLRKIATELGTSLNTVQRDLAAAPVLKSTPDLPPPAPAPAPKPPEPKPEPKPTPRPAAPPPPPPSDPPTVKGRDGKTYPAKRSPKPEPAPAPPPAAAKRPATEEERGLGMIAANKAIDILRGIPKGDRLRRQALLAVQDWITLNK